MANLKHSNVVFILIYALLLFLIGYLAWPFVTPIIFAGIIAGTLTPLMYYIQQKFKVSHKWAAIIVCLIIVIALILPSIYLVVQLSKEAFGLYQFLKENFTETNITAFLFKGSFFPDMMKELFSLANMEYNVVTIQNIVLEAAKNVSSTLFNMLNQWVSNIFSFIFQFLIMLLVIYEILLKGPTIKQFMLDMSPLGDEEEELVLEKFNQMNFVILVGNGSGGLIQGILAGAGFWVAGFESVLLWSTAMVFFAFIPLVGISIIYVPASIYLFAIGKTAGAVVLFIYCAVISLAVDNWFKPRFVGNRVQINPTLVFLSIIGGLSVFGLAGIFYGPLIVSIFLTFVNLYHKKFD
ncbi:MAG: AI-2E family transporter [SAR324 cluster bacterium]|nr:AI-2E family transporter [SAR324 cluster bacterium]